MSCCHKRQSKEIDSVNCATSAAGPPLKRPLRETGDFLFIRWSVFNAKTSGRQAAKILAFLLAALFFGFDALELSQKSTLPARRRCEMLAPRSP